MKRNVALLLLALMAFTASADKLYFKNGDVLTGDVISSDQTSTKIQTEKGVLEFSTDTIQRIEYSDESQGSSDAPLPDTKDLLYRTKNSSLIWRPLPTLVGLATGMLDFVLEGQTAFSRQWAGTVIFEFGSVSGITVSSFQIGPQYRPAGSYLNGFFFGVYPGFGYVTDYLDWVWFVSGTAEIGYQWVLQSSFLLGLSTGFTYITFNPIVSGFKFNLSAHFGFVYRDPLFKAK